MNDLTISSQKAAILLGVDPVALREAIQNGTFEYGFKYKTKKGKWIYKVATVPLANKLGVTVEEMLK